MRRLLLFLVPITLVAGCKKHPPPVATHDPAAPASARSSSAASASAAKPKPAAPRPVPSQTCTLDPPRGVVVTASGHGGYDHDIAASKAGVVVGWLESVPSKDIPDYSARVEMVRAFDASLVPAGPPDEIAHDDPSGGFITAVAPWANDGTLGTGTCQFAAEASDLECSVDRLKGKTLGAFEVKPFDTPPGDHVAVAAVGAKAVLLHSYCSIVESFATSEDASHELRGGSEDDHYCEGNAGVDVLAVTATTGGHAFGAWRRKGVIEGREIAPDGKPSGKVVRLSAPGRMVGAPTVRWDGTQAIAAYASRAKASDPWKITFAKWKPGATVVRAAVDTGAEPAMAPALAATSDPACVLMSWTEGRGHGTRGHAAHVCADALVQASKVDVSGAGMEAGDTELAAAPNGAYVVWQEVPAKGPADLRVARLRCR